MEYAGLTRPTEANTVKRTILHCQIDEDLMRRVKEQAAKEERTLTAVVVRALERYLSK